MQHQKKTKAHPGITLLILLLIFSIPFLMAYLMYHKHIGLPKTSTHHGYLITPSFSISHLKLYNSDGKFLDNKLTHQKDRHFSNLTTNGRWLLMLFYPDACQRTCQEDLRILRQVRLATGKYRQRVQRALLTYHSNPSLHAMLLKNFSGTRHFIIHAPNYRAVIQKELPLHTVALNPGTIYLVDPLSNMVLLYPPKTTASAIFKDLYHLLKVSQIG